MRAALFALVFPLLVGGCATNPESLCNHVIDLAEREFGKLDQSGPGTRAAAVKKCVDEKSALKGADRRKYDCFASCAMDVRTLPEAAECEPKCGLSPKRSEPDPEPSEVPGIWVDPTPPTTPPTTPSTSASTSTSSATTSSASASSKPSGK